MTLATLLLTSLIVLIIVSLPIWPYSRGWGFMPSVIFGIAWIIVLILFLIGFLR